MPEEVDNRKLSLSSAGTVQLQRYEGLHKSYYNDPAGHCTYGVGTLVHMGPCTAEELHTPVSDQMIALSLQAALADTQRLIKKRVTKTQLTQEQFDALTSFVYNRGGPRSERVLKLIDHGDFKTARAQMNRVIYGTVSDPKTGKPVKKALPGLILRRRAETRPFANSGTPK